jgi:ankyrin repeat protein
MSQDLFEKAALGDISILNDPELCSYIDSKEKTALHHLAQKANGNTVKAILAHPAISEYPDLKGYTPLHYIAGVNDVEVIEEVLKHPLVDKLKASGEDSNDTPLHCIGKLTHPQIVKLFLSHPSVCIKESENQFGLTPIQYLAEYADNVEVAQAILNHPGIFNPHLYQSPLMRLALSSHIEIAKLILEHKLVDSIKDSSGDTPLHKLASNYKMSNQKAKLVMSHPSVGKLRNNKGSTPLHKLAETRDAEIINLLFEIPGFYTVKNDEGDAPVHILAYMQDDESSIMLMNNSKAINLQNDSGETPLHLIANSSVDMTTLQKLLRHPQVDKVKDNNGNTLTSREFSYHYQD